MSIGEYIIQFDHINSVLNISQTPIEIAQFMGAAELHVPNITTIVEIGCWTGGNLCLLSNILTPPGLIVGINPITNHPVDRINVPLVSRLVHPNQFIYIDGYSEDPNTYDRLLTALDGRSIDVLFMDRTDKYDEAMGDYNMYSKLMNSPSVIGFHDVAAYPDGPGGAFDEVCGDNYIRIDANDNRGIGVILI